MATKFDDRLGLDSLDEIIAHIGGRRYTNMVWIGKNYSVADLERDLKRIAEGDPDGLSHGGASGLA